MIFTHLSRGICRGLVPGHSAYRKKKTKNKKLKDAQAPNIKWHSTYINLESFNVAITVYESQEIFVVVVNAESGEFFLQRQSCNL